MKNIKILCADGLEECEALIIHDLLKRSGMNVKLVNIHNKEKITSSHNLVFYTDEKLNEIKLSDIDGIVLPGGLNGTNNLRNNEKIISIIKKINENKKLIAAICAAPDILAQINLVEENKFSCYPGCDYHLKANKNDISINDNIITAKALGSAFKLAKVIIEYLLNDEIAKNTLEQIYY